ncbi:hypothetical protein J4438_01745, partial [Candidatus Woesearchaeota archaeon]|nr:hypothetical protein [Candidatus Woesearchaeota archaeon]
KKRDNLFKEYNNLVDQYNNKEKEFNGKVSDIEGLKKEESELLSRKTDSIEAYHDVEIDLLNKKEMFEKECKEKIKSFEDREGEISRQLVFIENTKVKLLKAKFDVEEAYGKTLKHIII